MTELRCVERLIGVVFGTAVFALSAHGQEAIYKESVYQDFRNKNAVLDQFNAVGGDAIQYANPEVGGLRITFPAKRKATAAVGVQGKITVVGDFAITGGYELLAADAPPRGVAGVILFIMQGPDGTRSTRLGRFNTSEGTVYGINHTDPDKKPAPVQFPTETMAGQLRLQRRGSTLHYLVSDETTQGKFRELHRTEFGNRELTVIRFALSTSERPVAADARLVDLRIEFTGETTAATPAVKDEKDAVEMSNRERRAVPSARPALVSLVLGAGVIVTLAIGLGVWALLRRRASADKRPS